MRTALAAELSKLISLPTTWIAFAISLLLAPVVAAIRATQELTAIVKGSQNTVGFAIGFEELGFGVAGVIILGVLAISSEYFTEGEEAGNGRQMTTSLMVTPSRLRLLGAKAIIIATLSALLAILTIPLTLGVVQFILGEHAPLLDGTAMPRLTGVVLYWMLTALLALGITCLTRHAALPLAIMLLNTSVMTVSYLLTRITPWANYLPDMAGLRMFHELADTGSPLTPAAGGMVMSIWVSGILVLAAIRFYRRDV